MPRQPFPMLPPLDEDVEFKITTPPPHKRRVGASVTSPIDVSSPGKVASPAQIGRKRRKDSVGSSGGGKRGKPPREITLSPVPAHPWLRLTLAEVEKAGTADTAHVAAAEAAPVPRSSRSRSVALAGPSDDNGKQTSKAED